MELWSRLLLAADWEGTPPQWRWCDGIRLGHHTDSRVPWFQQLCLSAVTLIASLSPWADSKMLKTETVMFTSRFRIMEGNFFMCMWLALTGLVVALPFVLRRRDLMFSGLLATLGTYLRWHLAPAPQLCFPELQAWNFPGKCGWCVAIEWCCVCPGPLRWQGVGSRHLGGCGTWFLWLSHYHLDLRCGAVRPSTGRFLLLCHQLHSHCTGGDDHYQGDTPMDLKLINKFLHMECCILCTCSCTSPYII